MSTDEVSGASFANSILEVTEGLIAQGGIREARSNYQFAAHLLRDWLAALVSDDARERERAQQQPLPAGIDRVYLATQPWMGQFRMARYENDRESARTAGEIAVQVFARLTDVSPRTADCLEEVGTFFGGQNAPEDREYGQNCIKHAERIREYVRLTAYNT